MIDWQPLRLQGGRLSPWTKRAHYKGWALTWYTLDPEEFMAHIGGRVLRSKTEKGIVSQVDEVENKKNETNSNPN
jgi:hypothetical protein